MSAIAPANTRKSCSDGPRVNAIQDRIRNIAPAPSGIAKVAYLRARELAAWLTILSLCFSRGPGKLAIEQSPKGVDVRGEFGT